MKAPRVKETLAALGERHRAGDPNVARDVRALYGVELRRIARHALRMRSVRLPGGRARVGTPYDPPGTAELADALCELLVRRAVEGERTREECRHTLAERRANGDTERFV